MARNPFSFDGVDAGVLFLDGSDDGTVEHRVLGSTAARFSGANWSRAGIVEGERDDFGVTVDASRVVTIAAGLCFVQHSDGVKYGVENRANKTLTLAAPDASLTRVDAVVLTVDTATVTAALAATQGTAGAGNPAAPANSHVLAYVTVPPSGAPTVSLPATRFAIPKGPAAAASSSGGGGSSGRRTIQRPSGNNVAAMFNDRLFTRDATRLWALTPAGGLLEYELGDYGFVRNAVAERSFGGASAGKPLLPYWDAVNGNLWAIKGDRGHIVESDTASRVTTGSSSISLSEIVTGAPVAFADFGNGGGLGVQSGGKYFVVGNSGAGNDVAIAEVSVAVTVGGGSVQLVAGAAGIVEHTANAESPAHFAAPGDGGSILAGFITTADLSFHTQAQNGRVEQWSAAGVKAATFAELPSGSVFGEAFDLARRLIGTGQGRYYIGPAPNHFASLNLTSGTSASAGIISTTSGAAWDAWRAAYENDPFACIQADAGQNAAPPQSYARLIHRATNGQWTTLPAGTVADAVPGGSVGGDVNGIYTLTRIDGTLCYASAELIVPVLNAGDQANFWPYG